MRLLTFSGRTAKEILRDPLNLGFGLGFPLVLLLLLSAIQANIPVSLFEIESLTPGITVFGLSFMTLFSATLIAKDRESALLQRLYTTPLTAADFIFGYVLPVLPISLVQGVICYLSAMILGLPMQLKDIQKYSELRYCGKSTIPERMKILDVYRKYVLEQQQKWNEYLQNLDDKIEYYRQAINEQPEDND